MVEMDQVEKYWNTRPCNVRHGTAPVGSPEWSRQVTERKYFVEPHIPGFAQFERWRGKEVLEIGCGIGTDTIEFVKAGARVFAVDVSTESVHLARARLSQYGEGQLVSVRNAEEGLPDWSFDLIYSFGVIHHTPHPDRVLHNAWNCLKADGELRIMLYAKGSLKYLFGEQPEAQAGCPIARFYSKRQARKLLETCGFQVVSIEKAHIFPWRISDYVKYRYIKRWPYRIMPEQLFAWLERRLGHHLLIVAKKRT